jgi:6'''-hydroxyparomomycin oxidase
MQSVDVCVIGSGAGGSVAASELARQGLRVLVLEQGNAPRAGDSLRTMEPSWPPALVPARDGSSNPVGRPWSACALGGGMSIFAGIAFRLRHVDFDTTLHTPAGAFNPRWPIRYQDLRPWYDGIERLIGIARAADADPTEPDGAPPVMEPHAYSVSGRMLADAGRILGMRPFPTPLAINAVPYGGRPACHRCGPCNEYVCPSGAKADVAALLLAPFARSGALTISTASRALRVLLSDSNRVTGVEWLNGAVRCRRSTKARVVVLAANAVQSAALLLRSKSRHAPRGIGNGYGMVGRGLSFKVSRYVEGDVTSPTGVASLAGPFSTVSFTDFYVDEAAPSGLGGLIYEASPDDRDARGGRIQLRLHCLAADQPMPGNRVRLSTETDSDGAEKVILDYRTHSIDAARLKFLTLQATQILRAAGASAISIQQSGYQLGSRHLHGTCRAGTDPRSSVIDPWGRVHEIENLYVVDGGYFPYAGGVNPAFTIQANAWRISTEIARRLGASPTPARHSPVAHD